MKLSTLKWIFLVATLTLIFVAKTAHAFEPFTLTVNATPKSVTFTTADPRPMQSLTTANVVTTDGFETTVAVDWKPAEGGPGNVWTMNITDDVAEIYFVSNIPIDWSITGPWTPNEKGNGIIRYKKVRMNIPLLFSN